MTKWNEDLFRRAGAMADALCRADALRGKTKAELIALCAAAADVITALEKELAALEPPSNRFKCIKYSSCDKLCSTCEEYGNCGACWHSGQPEKCERCTNF